MESSEKEKDYNYPRSTSAPYFIANKTTSSKLQSFIELHMATSEKLSYSVNSKGDLNITIPEEQLKLFFGANNKNYIRDISSACESLMDRRIKFFADNGVDFTLITLFPKCEYKHGSLTVQISPEGIQAYHSLSQKNYCLYDCVLIRSFKHRTTSFFYDLALRARRKGDFYFKVTLEQLKSQFLEEREDKNGKQKQNCTDSQIKARWVLPSLKELHSKYDENAINFYLELPNKGIEFEQKGGAGRKKISAFVIYIHQKVADEKTLTLNLLAEISILLDRYLKDRFLSISLMQPWYTAEITYPMVQQLKKKLDAYPSLCKKGLIHHPVAWIRSVMSIKNVNVDAEDIDSREDADKFIKAWEELKKEYISMQPGDHSAQFIDIFILFFFDSKENMIGLQMREYSDPALDYIKEDKHLGILKDLVAKYFNKDAKLNIIINKPGNTGYSEEPIF